ncbi:unnamed protein product [Penicillium salamii]|nr:unnamed protein product [Penicillium salamii]
MAGPSKSLVLDPAYQKFYELNSNRYKYWRWTPRHASLAFVYMGVIPSIITYFAYKYEVREWNSGRESHGETNKYPGQIRVPRKASGRYHL